MPRGDGHRLEVPSSTLFAVVAGWCEANGEYMGSNKALSQGSRPRLPVRRTNKGGVVLRRAGTRMKWRNLAKVTDGDRILRGPMTPARETYMENLPPSCHRDRMRRGELLAGNSDEISRPWGLRART